MRKNWISKRKTLKLQKQSAKEELARKIGKLSGNGGNLIERDPSISDALSLVRAAELEKRK